MILIVAAVLADAALRSVLDPPQPGEPVRRAATSNIPIAADPFRLVRQVNQVAG
jgi:hypothetical protein